MKKKTESKKTTKPVKTKAKVTKAVANTPEDAPKTSCSKFPSFSR